MDHVVYLDAKARELENLTNGSKSMIMRGAMGRKMPFGRVKAGHRLFLIENKGDGLVKASAIAGRVSEFGPLTHQASNDLVDEQMPFLLLDKGLKARFAGKRYLVFIEIAAFEVIQPFRINRSGYSNMDDWLPVGEVEKVRAD